ncbi:MAG: ATP-binding protein [Thermoplasmata archaeon]
MTNSLPSPDSRSRAVISWSSGKDSALALQEVYRSGSFEVVGLLTTVSEAFHRVSMHGVREELLVAQAESLGLPLHVVRIPSPCPNAVYEERMAAMVHSLQLQGVSHIVFGDLFLEDIRHYREAKLAKTGIQPVFPLWGRPTRALAEEMLAMGIQCVLVCVDPRVLGKEFAGRWFSRELLEELPASVDPCGERGEFHTFVAGSPLFRAPIAVDVGPVVERDGFVFADLTRRSG